MTIVWSFHAHMIIMCSLHAHMIIMCSLHAPVLTSCSHQVVSERDELRSTLKQLQEKAAAELNALKQSISSELVKRQEK